MARSQPQPLPKFGEWDVKNPSSADGFTVIFAKARDEKKATGTVAGAPKANQAPPPTPSPQRTPQKHKENQNQNQKQETEPTKSRFCCF